MSLNGEWNEIEEYNIEYETERDNRIKNRKKRR